MRGRTMEKSRFSEERITCALRQPAAGTAVSQCAARWRELTLFGILVVPLATLILGVPPIAQNQAYHSFADTRSVFRVPHFANVASNVVFLALGIAGRHVCASGTALGAVHSWRVFFWGTTAIAAGSAFYHWNPNNSALAWDRLPMTLAFMALFTALLAEHVALALERLVLPLAVFAGAASVAWWLYADDLRFYAWVQFAPLAGIVFLLLAHRGCYSHRRFLAFGLAAYLLAKAAEWADGAVFEVTSGTISGHTLKHLLAGIAISSVTSCCACGGLPCRLP